MTDKELSIGRKLYLAHADSLSVFYKNNLNDQYNEHLRRIVSTLLRKKSLDGMTGTVYFISCGKTLTVCNKISAMLNSLDISSRSLNANECLHGDIGTINVNRSEDIVFGVSISGNTREVINCLNLLIEKTRLSKKITPMITVAMIIGTRECEMYEGVSKWNYTNTLPIVLDYSDIIKDSELYKGIKAPTLSLQLLYLYMDCLFLDVVDEISTGGDMSDAFLMNHPSGGLGRR
jgi:hypothetical protein